MRMITFRVARDEVQPVTQILPAMQVQMQDEQVVRLGGEENDSIARVAAR